MRRSYKCFTLVEIVVAFALLVIAAASITKILEGTYHLRQKNRRMTLASMLAREKMEECYALWPFPAEGVTRSAAEDGIYEGLWWQRVIEPRESADTNLYNVIVTVKWDAEGEPHRVTLRSIIRRKS